MRRVLDHVMTRVRSSCLFCTGADQAELNHVHVRIVGIDMPLVRYVDPSRITILMILTASNATTHYNLLLLPLACACFQAPATQSSLTLFGPLSADSLVSLFYTTHTTSTRLPLSFLPPTWFSVYSVSGLPGPPLQT